MNTKNIQLIAMDLDGTLTQHKQPLDAAHKEALDRLGRRYSLLIAGAGQVGRIFSQIGHYPIDIIGNYGMQYGEYDRDAKEIRLVRDIRVAADDREQIERKAALIRETYGYTVYSGGSVEFHPSGCLTLPLLGTAADAAEKLAFDPDRKKRRKIYDAVAGAFPDYHVFVGGSSSFDLAPKPYDKYYALDLYCREKGLPHENVVYIGDDYGLGGNDESVYRSDFNYLTIDHYQDFPQVIQPLLASV